MSACKVIVTLCQALLSTIVDLIQAKSRFIGDQLQKNERVSRRSDAKNRLWESLSNVDLVNRTRETQITFLN